MNRIQKQIIKDALENSEILSDWEWGFISDLADKDDRSPGYELTKKQNDVINRIGSRTVEQ